MGTSMLSEADLKSIGQKYIDDWVSKNSNDPLWVSLASPGDPINVPGITFGTQSQSVAGMHYPVHAQLIVLNRLMTAESKLCTFLHEYGHLLYAKSHCGEIDVVASEVEAIRFSLEALEREGYPDLCRREAIAVQQMATAEPYKSAVVILSQEPIWQRYTELANPS